MIWEENSGLDLKKEERVDEKESAASDGVMSSEARALWSGSRSGESSALREDHDGLDREGKIKE